MGPTLTTHLDFLQKLSLLFLFLSVKVLKSLQLGAVAYPKMLLSKTVAAASFLMIAVISQIWAIPSPAIFRERHIIHAPIKFRTIHHYSVKKVPLIITKHLHFYKQKEDIHHFPQPNLEENHENQIHQEDDYHQFEFHKQEKHPKDYTPKFPPYEHWKPQEEEYDEHEQSQEEYDEDYEYE